MEMKNRDHHFVALDEAEAALGTALEATLEVAGLERKRGMILPFQPLSISFDDVKYYVDMPAVSSTFDFLFSSFRRVNHIPQYTSLQNPLVVRITRTNMIDHTVYVCRAAMAGNEEPRGARGPAATPARRHGRVPPRRPYRPGGRFGRGQDHPDGRPGGAEDGRLHRGRHPHQRLPQAAGDVRPDRGLLRASGHS